MQFDNVGDAIHELRAGHLIVLVDDEHDYSGDLVMAAETVNSDAINFMAMHGRGLIHINFPAACPNVLLISHPNGERHQLAAHNLVLWGRGMVEHEPTYHPLGGIPRPQGDAWHIALGHGFFMEDDVPSSRSSPIYAGEIRASGWDYIALGHCHAFADASRGPVTAYYSGAPGFFPGAHGADGHVALVQCNAEAARPVDVQRLDLRPLVNAALEQRLGER